MIASTSHSARVSLEFRTGNTRIPLSQLALGFAISAEPVELAPCAGEILMTIDGSETRMSVFLPDGIKLARPRFELRSCETIS